ncbi:FecCD family ABC transporter permease [Methanomassiliicoccus luminyensis]|jgi:iron complex transport system permease protein|uniref:FecCD family ABC transporter permease n=1 Tax=Methanomassiliicoccus luminyensis TaxID=1080712 RepID=UPI00036FAE35|nr:iron ABC transporter permease [Methanomassiliicoccus luminyensis]
MAEADKVTEAERTGLMDILRNRISYDGLEGAYNVTVRKRVTFILFLLALTVIASVAALGIGSVDIPVTDTLRVIGHALFPSHIEGPEREWYSAIILNSRMPRVFMAVITGLSLAMSGVIMQGILRNPLVSPFTLGVSSAASFGAAMALVYAPMMFGAVYYESATFLGQPIAVKNLLLILFSFLFGLGSVGLVLLISKRGDVSRSTMILSGVVISYLFQAGISFAKYISNDDALREITLWLMGGMWGVTWGSVIMLLPIVVVCFGLMEKLTVDINTLSTGDEVASSLGISVNKLRTSGLVLSALVSSACLAFTGIIGFIGLMAPHICRRFIGNDNRYLLPASALMGALILLISDTVARMIISPSQLPVGVIMYIIGGIFFIWLVTRKNWRNMA